MKLKTLTIMSYMLASTVATTPLLAEDDWFKFYGKINVAFDQLDFEGEKSDWEFNSYASRIGLKGKGALTENLELFYQYEWEVDVVFDSGDKFKERNQVVGLRGNWGEVFAGRHDTPTKTAQEKIDLFSDMPGDLKNTFNGDKRSAKMVQYTTPVMNNFKVKAAVITDEDDVDGEGFSTAAGYKAGGLLVGFAYDNDVEKEDLQTLRIMSRYKMADWQFGFMYQNSDYHDNSADGILLSTKYNFGDNTLKVQYYNSDIWDLGISSKIRYSDQVSLGYDRKLMKDLTAYGYYSEGKEGETESVDNIYGVGIVFKF
ncbi:MAG: hypothetical protein DRQ47_05125 [Gammaproteobacteria bacterium]|nr:MAG: hypothetical protein DRQ47_05125 [Gammaproteobacteria bacterium]